MGRHKYLFARRIVQVSTLILFILAAKKGINILAGDLSYVKILDKIPLADPYAVLQMLAAGAKITIDLLLGAVIVLFFYSLVFGRVFCSWVCPVNLVSDLAGWLRRKLKLDKSEKQALFARNIRYWAMGLGLLLSLAFGMTAFELISPVGIVQRGLIFGMGLGWFVIIALFLFDLLVLRNGFCGNICPLGGFYSLTGKISQLRIKHIKEKCTLCMLCKDVCPEKQVLQLIGQNDGLVKPGECTNCGRCIEVCDDYALDYTLRTFYKGSTKGSID